MKSIGFILFVVLSFALAGCAVSTVETIKQENLVSGTYEMYELNYSDLFDVAKEVVRNKEWEVKEINEDTGWIVAQTPRRFSSEGELVSIRISFVDENRCNVIINSNGLWKWDSAYKKWGPIVHEDIKSKIQDLRLNGIL